MGFTISGLSSGVDWQSIVQQLTEVETSQFIEPLNTKKTNLQDKLTAWQSLSTKLLTLKTAVGNLKDTNDFDDYNADLTSSSTTSAESLLSVTVGSYAASGRYDITVSSLAKAEKIQSGAVSSRDTDAGWTGSITLAGTEISLDGKSLSEMKSAINALNTGDDPSGVVASIIQVSDSDYRLTLTSEETGAAGINLIDSGNYFSNVIQDGNDAQFKVDGVSMTRSSNTITDVISGLTLDLNGEDADTTITVNVTTDVDALAEKVQAFVDAANAVLDYTKEQLSYDSTTGETGGALYGDATLKSIRSNILNSIVNADLSSLGISINSSNELELDTDTLTSALEGDFNNTVTAFNSMAESFDDTLEHLTDSIDGSLTLRENSIQDNIDRLDDKITSTQERIDRRMALMTKQYQAMELAITQLQSQQSYLSALLSSDD